MPIFLVVDDHDAVLQFLLPMLQNAYPAARLLTARDCKTAKEQLQQQPSLVLLDIYLPEVLGDLACYEAGLGLLEAVMASESVPNILVLGTRVKPLVRLNSKIYHYPAGFTAIGKTEAMNKLLKMVDLTLRGSVSLPTEVRSRPDFKPQWLTLLTLKFQRGLSDRAIAERMGISTRTVRSYWLHIQDDLEVYDDPDKDLRIQIEQAARRAGLID
ncbi:MAG: DNA-binding response regulator [Phormidesmis sp.]